MKTKVLHFTFPGVKPKVVDGESRGDDGPMHKWHEELIKTSNALLTKPCENLVLPSFAPISAFNEAVLRGDLLKVAKGTLIEVELTDRDKYKPDQIDSSIKAVWIAEIVHMVGYYFLCRWLGAPKSDGGFWVHAANGIVHPVGWCESKRDSFYFLCPPSHIFELKTSQEWADYILNRVNNRFTLNVLYDESKANVYACKFNVGDRLEVVHDDESTSVVPAVITRTCGRRILLDVSRPDVDSNDAYSKDNYWRDQSDDLIYYVAFGAEQGYNLRANKRYKEHTEKIAKALKEGTTPQYSRHDLSFPKVVEWKETESTAKWEKSMSLEIFDRIDTNLRILKPARVLRVMKHGYLQVGPEGRDIQDDSFVIHQSSPMLFPVGYAKEHGIRLKDPDSPDDNSEFLWEPFLKRTGFKPAPKHFFHDSVNCSVPFLVGQRMEAIDQNEKVICPAKVKEIKGRLLLISFDGWGEEFDQLYDFRSNELLPCGWCEMQGHRLQPPVKAMIDSEEGEPSRKKHKT